MVEKLNHSDVWLKNWIHSDVWLKNWMHSDVWLKNSRYINLTCTCINELLKLDMVICGLKTIHTGVCFGHKYSV